VEILESFWDRKSKCYELCLLTMLRNTTQTKGNSLCNFADLRPSNLHAVHNNKQSNKCKVHVILFYTPLAYIDCAKEAEYLTKIILPDLPRFCDFP